MSNLDVMKQPGAVFGSRSNFSIRFETLNSSSSSHYSNALEFNKLRWQQLKEDIRLTEKAEASINLRLNYTRKHLLINAVGLTLAFTLFTIFIFLHYLLLASLLFIIMFGFIEMLVTVLVDRRSI